MWYANNQEINCFTFSLQTSSGSVPISFNLNSVFNCSSVSEVIDLDFFKKVNDNYGHDIGDKVLIHVADLLKTHVRTLDVVARVGGEEFLILLPHTHLVDALNVAEKIRACIEAHPFQCPEEKECRIDMTVSIGVAEAEAYEQLNEAILSADEHLFTAKRNGRNCVKSQVD